MKILQLMGPGRATWQEVPTPSPGPGEVLVKVLAVTTCPHWDLHIYGGQPMFPGDTLTYPYTAGQPGHEMTGTVVAVGDGVTEFSAGDRVSAWRDVGHHQPGCYAEYVVRKPEDLIAVPPHLDPAAVAPVELAMCLSSTILMLREMKALAGQRVGIGGLGPAGLVASQLARAEGAREVIGFDPSPARRKYALAFAVDRAVDPTGPDGASFPRRLQPGSLETAIDCCGLKASVEYLMDVTSYVVALFGVQREDYTFAPRHYGFLKLCGYTGHYRAAAEYAVQQIEAGKLDLLPLVTHRLPLTEYDRGVDLLRRQEALKVCFFPR